MSREQKRNLKIEFENLRPDAYQFALNAEAERLNCALLDVRPQSPVLPLELGYDPRFILATLPDEILAKTLRHLDCMDVFRMTLVCRRWKSLVYNNCAELKRAEHAVTTHLITFTDWMDPAQTPSCEIFECEYCQFSWCLVRWCCGISSNLETLVLDHQVSYPDVATLLQSCPNLKNLQLGLDSAYHDFDSYMGILHFETIVLTGLCVAVLGGLLPEKVHLPNLEVYLSSKKEFVEQMQQVDRDVLCSAKSLRVLRASMEDGIVRVIERVRPLSDVFRHLVALDLIEFSYSVLEALVSIPNLQLKYLRLSHCYPQDGRREETQENFILRYRELFHQLLPKLKKLEVLETWRPTVVTNETIQLLTDLDLDLTFVVLVHSSVEEGCERYEDISVLDADPLDPALLTEFRDRLLFRNPELVLSDFHFIVEGEFERDQLLAEDIGFTFRGISGIPYKDYASSGLCYPSMRNRLNISF